MDEVLKDKRFSHVFTDPRCRRVPIRVQKVFVDKRFEQMFKDKKFKENSHIDKRGQLLHVASNRHLKRIYNLTSESSEEEEEEKDENQLLKDDTQLEKPVEAAEDSDSDESSSDESSLEQKVISESSSEDESTTEDEDDDLEHPWEQVQKDVPDANEISKRLAVCNMDWDRINAHDLFAVFNSFKPSSGCIHSVKIYPSDFGLECMQREKVGGPAELVETKLDSDVDDIDEEDPFEAKQHTEKLRQYQLNRLKYYYAIVDCDSPDTANVLYEHLNLMEYESSGLKLDLRFVPDIVTFDQKPHSEALTQLDITSYKPSVFINSAFQQGKVNLTWDETDPRRKQILDNAFKQNSNIEDDVKIFLASSSSEEDVGDLDERETFLSKEENLAKYRTLLESLEEKEKEKENDDEKYEMEITWESGLTDKTEENRDKAPLTPFEEVVEKIKEKRKKKKLAFSQKPDDADNKAEIEDEDFFTNFDRIAERKLAKSAKNQISNKTRLDDLSLTKSDSKVNKVDLEKSSKRKKTFKAKKNSKVEELEDFQFNLDDPRFSAVYSSHLFNIDPSDPHFRPTPGTSAIIQEKQKKFKNVDIPEQTSKRQRIHSNCNK